VCEVDDAHDSENQAESQGEQNKEKAQHDAICYNLLHGSPFSFWASSTKFNALHDKTHDTLMIFHDYTASPICYNSRALAD
jgi:hypothetical protein